MAANSTANHVMFDDVTTSPDPYTDENDLIANLDRYLWIYCSPWILFLGLFGNILIIVVVKSRKLQNSSTAVYLPMLAVFDSFTLLTGIIPEWLDAMQLVTIKEISGVTCKLEKFLFYVSADTATWILVLFTVDRFVAVCFPLQKRTICTPKCARIACFSFFLLSVTKNAHVFWTRGPEYDELGNLTSNCGRPEPYTEFELFIRPWIAFVYANLIPFVLIIICNIMIIRTLVRVQKMRKAQTNAEKSMTQTVLMCLSASFTFLIFITPSMALLIGRPYWTSDDDPNYAYDIAKAVNNQLVMVNHSINVILYCASGQKFREDVIEIFKCRCLSSDTFHSGSEEEKNKARLSKQKSGDSADPVNVTTKNTTMSSLASTPTKEGKDITAKDINTHPNGHTTPVIQDTEVEIDLKDFDNSETKLPSTNLPLSANTIDIANQKQPNTETEYVSQKDRVTEKDSGLGLKEGQEDLAEESMKRYADPSDFLSARFEEDLVGAGDHSSSFTNISEDCGIAKKDQDTAKAVHSTESPKGSFQGNIGSNTTNTHGSSSEPSTASELPELAIIESGDDNGRHFTPIQTGVLHFDNDVIECTDTEDGDAAQTPVANSSGKMSPVLKVVAMETTHF